MLGIAVAGPVIGRVTFYRPRAASGAAPCKPSKWSITEPNESLGADCVSAMASQSSLSSASARSTSPDPCVVSESSSIKRARNTIGKPPSLSPSHDVFRLFKLAQEMRWGGPSSCYCSFRCSPYEMSPLLCCPCSTLVSPRLPSPSWVPSHPSSSFLVVSHE